MPRDRSWFTQVTAWPVPTRVAETASSESAGPGQDQGQSLRCRRPGRRQTPSPRRGLHAEPSRGAEFSIHPSALRNREAGCARISQK